MASILAGAGPTGRAPAAARRRLGVGYPPILTVATAVAAWFIGEPWMILLLGRPACPVAGEDAAEWHAPSAAMDFPPVSRVQRAFFLIGRSQAQGLIRFHADRLSGQDPRLIEYKGPSVL